MMYFCSGQPMHFCCGVDSHPTTSRMKRKPCPAPCRNLSNLSFLPLSSRAASCVSPICPTTRSTASADMKQPFGAKSARSCSRLMLWIAANHRTEGLVSGSATYTSCRPTSAMSVDFPARRPRHCSTTGHLIGIAYCRGNWLRFVKPHVEHLTGEFACRLGWREDLVDQLVVFSFEWIDEGDALQRETVLEIFGKQVPHASTLCRGP